MFTVGIQVNSDLTVWYRSSPVVLDTICSMLLVVIQGYHKKCYSGRDHHAVRAPFVPAYHANEELFGDDRFPEESLSRLLRRKA